MLGRVYYGEIRLHTNSSFETCQTADFFYVARVVVPLPHLVTPLKNKWRYSVHNNFFQIIHCPFPIRKSDIS